MHRENTLNGKIEFFYRALDECISKIPKSEVYFSNNDKEWITPLVKHLINSRWKAFSSHNFVLYRHYQLYVKSEIIKAKKCMNHRSGVWNLVRKTAASPNTRILSLKENNENEEDLANRINLELIKSFTKSVKSDEISQWEI